MKRTQLTLPTTDELAINVYKWENKQSQPRGVIQIAHGMAEHALRYEEFSQFLTDNGWVIYANDHRGHGQTIANVDDKGFFANENGFDKVVHDMKLLSDKIKDDYPHLPLFIFGHSMGSFLTRRYVQIFNNDIAGIILSGTGGSKGVIGKVGLQIAKFERWRTGARTPSPLLDKLTFGQYNKEFSPARTKFDFLSRDEKQVDKYIADDLCGFICTAGFFVDLISGLDKIHQKQEMDKVNRSLPIFIISGDKDPVGDNGKGVKEVYEELYNRQENLTMKLYEGARHELINETNHLEVYEDILFWLNSNVEEKVI